MNVREIEHLWKVASNNPNHDTNWHDPVIVEFAELVIAAEREACIDIVAMYGGSVEIEAAIRARGQDPMPLFDDWNKDWTK